MNNALIIYQGENGGIAFQRDVDPVCVMQIPPKLGRDESRPYVFARRLNTNVGVQFIAPYIRPAEYAICKKSIMQKGIKR